MYLTLFGNLWNVLSNSSLEPRSGDKDNAAVTTVMIIEMIMLRLMMIRSPHPTLIFFPHSKPSAGLVVFLTLQQAITKFMGGMGPDPACKKGHQVVFILREMKKHVPAQQPK